MVRIAILGNSGSGKSTLAARLSRELKLATLDLDTVAWVPGQEAVAREPAEAAALVRAFCLQHERWVMEGCYASLIEVALEADPLLIWLDPGDEVCQAHCRARPWEPHKYSSPAAQERNLAMLLEWVTGYATREGELGRRAHAALFDRCRARKIHWTRAADDALIEAVSAAAA
ncbi:MAG: NACHT domain-containing protein [Burkholderiales bacterium]|nr:NACHT domain-containing protein [Burkholderiales bacterium]